MSASCHGQHHHHRDWLLWTTGTGVLLALAAWLAGWQQPFTIAVVELLQKMWWGVAFGIVFVGLLHKVPRELVMGALGKGEGVGGIARATVAGLLLDLCSHGILLVALKLYERGASLGQVMAFLIASPWNSLSLTIIMVSLIGISWTALFVVLSLVIAFVSGLIFNLLVRRKVLPANPNRQDLPDDFRFWQTLRGHVKAINWRPALFREMAVAGWGESTMILRWIFLGILLAAAMRAFIPADTFGSLFSPDLAGLGLTLLAATIIEVCSEGSMPIAADILNRAGAPGNAFAFLMAGAATDYTEVIGLREATKSWKIALFLPLVTVPQVVVLGWLLNLQ